jgi:GntR family phosphonate transport system transcriptional regulator
MLELKELPATATIAQALDIEVDDPCVLLTVLGEADGAPLSLGHNYFPGFRVKGILAALQEQNASRPQQISITHALRAAGVETYRRKRTRLAARLPTTEEARILRMARTQPIVETESIDVSDGGTPVTYANTCFRADRLQFVVGD